MLQITPDIIYFENDQSQIKIYNNTTERYNVHVRCSNTTAYEFGISEFVIEPNLERIIEIRIQTKRQIDVNDQFEISYKKLSSKLETAKPIKSLHRVAFQAHTKLHREFGATNTQNQIFQLEQQQDELNQVKTKLNQQLSALQTQLRELVIKNKALTEEFQVVSKSYNIISKKNYIVKMKNGQSVKNIAVLGVLFIVGVCLGVKL